MNQMAKDNKKHSSNSLVFGRWPPTKIKGTYIFWTTVIPQKIRGVEKLTLN